MRNSSPAGAALQHMQRPANGAILAAILFSTALAAFAVGAWSGQRCSAFSSSHPARNDRGLLDPGLRFASPAAPPTAADGAADPELLTGDPAGSGAAAAEAAAAALSLPLPEISEPTQFVPAFPENRPPRGSREELATLREEVRFLRRRARAFRLQYGEVYCKVHDVGPNGGFCVSPNASTAATRGSVTGTLMDTELCAALSSLLAGQRVADLGAGLGQYGKCLEPVVRQYVPYDGGEGVEAATGGVVHFLDLAEPTWIGTSYDWVISLEVGEHIPAAAEGAFLGNVLRHATRGVVLSWAVPGQGGHHHVNERTNTYVAGRVSELGGGRFALNATASAALRAASSFSWFKNTIMVFDVV
ncbi:hypothetical protein PLESTB_001383300 [Pleodorina starrii]|uniref:Uncharacterized protein n=1 Tax=Pleodorina starrii TaxID=330485 RepID=A0A9W6BW59_9CHLO|nr:hypothetical protein PLESTM_000401800 [Pleodorina starrii]GLC58641.1 hypothetical protein PLESTB_001383300 [Pleodorina starrii]GLC67452.1 hypothetical protein PLESTF_000559100 [Pleodorina starrii]